MTFIRILTYPVRVVVFLYAINKLKHNKNPPTFFGFCWYCGQNKPYCCPTNYMAWAHKKQPVDIIKNLLEKKGAQDEIK